MALSHQAEQNIVTALSAMGIQANFEYPGFFSITINAEYVGNFGDANGPLGGDLVRIYDEKTVWSWEGKLPSDDAAAMATEIAGAVAEMRKKADRDWRSQQVFEATEEFIGNKLVAVFPEATGGDIDPLVDARFRDAVRKLVENWVDLNVPSS